jgi:hypothetical protein
MCASSAEKASRSRGSVTIATRRDGVRAAQRVSVIDVHVPGIAAVRGWPLGVIVVAVPEYVVVVRAVPGAIRAM